MNIYQKVHKAYQKVEKGIKTTLATIVLGTTLYGCAAEPVTRTERSTTDLSARTQSVEEAYPTTIKDLRDYQEMKKKLEIEIDKLEPITKAQEEYLKKVKLAWEEYQQILEKYRPTNPKK